MPEVGSTAPDFSLYDYDRKIRKLSEFLVEGKKTILAFFPGAFTGVCTQEACAFRDNLSRLGAMDAVVLGVSRDSLDSHARFIEKYGLNFTLLSDEDLKVNNLYHTWVEKENYGRKYWGTERSTFVIGKDGKILKIFRKVKVDGHEQEVLSALS